MPTIELVQGDITLQDTDAIVNAANSSRQSRFVIHAVGPHWRDGRHGEEELLAGCNWRALALAEEPGQGELLAAGGLMGHRLPRQIPHTP
jgi:O-acetyl-ADP-ribose deacetylase (regulator of RNase III)